MTKHKKHQTRENRGDNKADKGFSITSILGRSQARKNKMGDKKFVNDFNRGRDGGGRGGNKKAVDLKMPSNFSLEAMADFKKKFAVNQGAGAVDSENIYFVALGGMIRIGKNCYLYGYKGKWLIVDSGMFVPDQREQPNVERIVPDVAFLQVIKKDIVGMFITHTHWDHLGAVLDVWPEVRCPIYCSPIVERVLLMIQEDTGKSDAFTLPINTLPKEGGKFQVGPFNCEAIHLTHSVMEAYGLAIKTGNGYIFHTGDFKVDETPLLGGETNFTRLKAIAKEGVLAVVSDSTNAIDGAFTKSEMVPRVELLKVVKGIKKGRILMTCFATSMVRMETAYLAAAGAGRKIALVGRSLERMYEIYKDLGYLEEVDFISLEELEKLSLPDNKIMYLCTGTQAEPFSAMTRLSQGTFRNLETKPGDTAIFSARIIPGNEKYVNKVHDSFNQRGVNVISTNQNPDIHASGHPAKEDLMTFYKLLDPEHIVPMHGTYTHLKCNFALIENIKKLHPKEIHDGIVLGNGDLLKITPEELKVVAKVPEGDVFIEKFRKFVSDDKIVANRKKIHFNGTLFCSFPIDKRGKVCGAVQVSTVGLAEVDDLQHVLDGVKRVVKDASYNAKPSKNSSLENIVENAIRVYIKRELNLRPVIALHVFKTK